MKYQITGTREQAWTMTVEGDVSETEAKELALEEMRLQKTGGWDIDEPDLSVKVTNVRLIKAL